MSITKDAPRHSGRQEIDAREHAGVRVFGLLLRTDRDYGQTLLRISLGAILFPHGAQHLLGWFGGYGFDGTLGWMTNDLGFPAPLAALAILTEFFAPFLLVVGLGSRLAALGIFGLMVGAASTHLQHGFFMNWFGALPAGAEGFEYHLLVIAIALAIVLKGSGAWSIDRALTTRSVERLTPATEKNRPVTRDYRGTHNVPKHRKLVR